MRKMIMSLTIATALIAVFSATPLFADEVVTITIDDLQKNLAGNKIYNVPEGTILKVTNPYYSEPPQTFGPGPIQYFPGVPEGQVPTFTGELQSIALAPASSISNVFPGSGVDARTGELVSGAVSQAMNSSGALSGDTKMVTNGYQPGSNFDQYDRIINLNGIEQGNHVINNNGVIEITK